MVSEFFFLFLFFSHCWLSLLGSSACLFSLFPLFDSIGYRSHIHLVCSAILSWVVYLDIVLGGIWGQFRWSNYVVRNCSLLNKILRILAQRLRDRDWCWCWVWLAGVSIFFPVCHMIISLFYFFFVFFGNRCLSGALCSHTPNSQGYFSIMWLWRGLRCAWIMARWPVSSLL